MAYRLGIDIGGTFTDATLINEATGEIFISKVSSTPKDHSLGLMEAVHRILRENKVGAEEVTYLVHGTTVATNSIIEGKIARTGFVTTEGFRDMLEIVDRAYILHDGRILMSGIPGEIVSDKDVRRVYLGEEFSL